MPLVAGQNATVKRPPRLRSDTRIALIAPSGPLLDRDDLQRAAELCRALGHEPALGSHAARRHGYLAGYDHERLADLNAALTADDVDAVWCIRGGYGVTRILAGVDFAALARRPKPVIGFSDITALLNALTRATGVVTFHGPTARHPLTAFRTTIVAERRPDVPHRITKASLHFHVHGEVPEPVVERAIGELSIDPERTSALLR